MKDFFWLYIEPYVHISTKKSSVFLYNCLNGKKLEYLQNPVMFNFANRLKANKNSLVIKVDSSCFEDAEMMDFFNKIRECYIGDLIKSSHSTSKPFQLKPILNIQKGVKFLKGSRDFNVGRGMMLNLKELVIYVNEACPQSCLNCIDSHKQFVFCNKSPNTRNELSISKIESVVENLQGTSIQKIRIVGGNILNYSKLEMLSSVFKDYSSIIEYYIHYKNVSLCIDKIKFIEASSHINILIDEEVNMLELLCVVETLVENKLSVKYNFIVSSVLQVNCVEKIISDFKIENSVVQPYFNGSNMSFFKKHIFINKGDIFFAKPTYNDIFTRETINQLNFGKLLIKPDGSIYSNINSRKLGNLNSSSMYDSVYKEMDNGKNWWRLRANVKPCKECLYNSLCPPISNYEIYMNKYDLCNVNKFF